MEHSRRNRRGRGFSHSNRENIRMSSRTSPQPTKAWSFFSTLVSFLITAFLIALTYAMLEQHCNNCKNKFDMSSIAKDISNMAKNLSTIKNNYWDLEKNISRFSEDLPKLEGQIDILELLARNVGLYQFGNWSPNRQLSILNNVDVGLNRYRNPQNNTLNAVLTQNKKDKR